MKLRIALALALPLLGACGSSDPRTLTDEGSKALSAGRYEEAAKNYEQALAALESEKGGADWKRAKLGWVQAKARTDAGVAKRSFLEFASASPGKVTDADFNLIASKFGDAGKFDEAIEILTVGKETFPESPHLDALGKDLASRAKASGASDALDKLKGLGYVGDD
jgi:tetratricopeptide (TPR) repeat protein